MKVTLDFAMLKISANLSGHMTVLSFTERLNFSIAKIMLEFSFIGSGPGLLGFPTVYLAAGAS